MKLHTRMVRRLVTAVALAAATSACGDVVRGGRSSVFLVVDSFTAAPSGGHASGTFAGTLLSDVLVILTSPEPCSAASPCPTVFDDFGQLVVHLDPKDIAVAPTSNNQVTLNRYHVSFRRADGRNAPGVDVPYGFDGTLTVTVPPSGSAKFSFELVRHVTKEESPLVQLISNPGIINTIADLTVYGVDQVGNAVSATASMTVEFGNFGDQ
jgi:hypothetical protein